MLMFGFVTWLAVASSLPAQDGGESGQEIAAGSETELTESAQEAAPAEEELAEPEAEDFPDAEELPGVVPPPVIGTGIEASVTGRKDARTMTLSMPAPRGQITDRNGEPFAQTRVVYYPALKYGQFERADREYVVEWGRARINQANELFGIEWNVSDEELWQH